MIWPQSRWSLTVLAVTAMIVPMAAPAQAAPFACQGFPATIVSSEESIVGTPGRDVIVVLGAGEHQVKAGAGNDLICGSPSADTINAGAGRDTVFGGGGSDVLHGGSGVDVLKGGAGADHLHGSTGKDLLFGGAGVDALQGGAGADSLAAGTGTNFCAVDKTDLVTGSCTYDSAAPRLLAQPDFSTEVRAGGTITFTWNLSDPVGIARTGLRIGGPSGWVTNWCDFAIEGILIAGTPQDGSYYAKCEVPESAVSQEYTAFFDASDVFGSWSMLGESTFTVIGGAEDSAAPIVTGIEILSDAIAVGDEFVIRYKVADPSGVEGAVVWLALDGYGFADNSARIYIEMQGPPVLVAGDANVGAYEIRLRISDYAPAGEYTVWTSVVDTLGNKALEQTLVTLTVVS